ncbi:hypothetical protein ACFORL_11770 [Legionella dresdenensis]|uniref:Uncharacterized protein n=1 Tax=Legionella dresdenensis TaxID=450200 RepID=A0ABV8CHE5_9GAMM
MTKLANQEIPNKKPIEEPPLPDSYEPGPDKQPEPTPDQSPEPEPVKAPEPLPGDSLT